MSKRIKFFFGHLLISIAIASCFVAWVFGVWYPVPLNTAVGVTSIFLMMVIIDIIVGPTLSLIVYKEGKKTLKMDITVILILQILALCYGVYNISEGRPIWIVYNVDRFELIRRNEVYLTHIDKAKPEYQKIPLFQPQYVATKFATDAKERADNMLEETLAGVSIAQRPERYVPFSEVKNDIQKRAIDLVELRKHNDKNKVEQILAKYPKATAYLPLKASNQDMTVLIDKQTAEVVKIVNLNPWESIAKPNNDEKIEKQDTKKSQ